MIRRASICAVLAAGLFTAQPAAGRPAYLGCYKDTGKRDLPLAHVSGKMTTQRCVAHCRARGHKYAATQFSSHCFCGNSFGRYGKLRPAKCQMRCSGDGRQRCGGSWANSVYRVGGGGAVVSKPPPGRVRYLGCFKDRGKRDLPKAFISGKMSTQRCVAHCRGKGYRYAGTQYGSQCFCGNSFGRYGRFPPSKCQMSCTGAARQRCGGYWANSVYQLR